MFLLFAFNYYTIQHVPEIIHPDNYVKANSLVTPPHIVPE
jgi:quinol-cytochrome oxidoreductase complex cytochrome b subunit